MEDAERQQRLPLGDVGGIEEESTSTAHRGCLYRRQAVRAQQQRRAGESGHRRAGRERRDERARGSETAEGRGERSSLSLSSVNPTLVFVILLLG